MLSQTRTTLIDSVCNDTDDEKDITVLIEHEKTDEQPYQVTIGCYSQWFWDEDIPKVVKMLQAAMRVRKKALS